ncbi:hypothetical protein NW752_005994 [Fusarium irregulare]|uniref:Uncharacterized protein n=1 Tax=Fusarium irregulare TaxID=2494466 RepID=A0A9W8U9M1_9HYPO|nr:hypothetical protein NW766_006531 [Fusarium irregulare]KAJ4016920.1 hypothetical protein NW752_005994 [Fusarium irregulare]
MFFFPLLDLLHRHPICGPVLRALPAVLFAVASLLYFCRAFPSAPGAIYRWSTTANLKWLLRKGNAALEAYETVRQA